jgi:acetylornithine deacetylase/succinyl-diaminopimelate desuccinylase-like protein
MTLSSTSRADYQTDHHVTSLRETRPLEVMRRLWATPTFEVHGVVGGYTGPGVKAAIPPRAEVKLSCRLVPNMTCGATLDRIQRFVAERSPDVEVQAEPGLDPFKGRTTGPLADAIRAAYRFGFGAGLSLPEHGYHAPNEFFDWEQAAGGIAAIGHFFQSLAAAGRASPRP